MSLLLSFKWSSTTWWKLMNRSQSHGCVHPKDTMRTCKTMMISKLPDSGWEPLTDSYILSENRKSWVSYHKPSSHYWLKTIGDTSTLQSWLCPRSVSTLMNQRRSHQSYKWSSDLWETLMPCLDMPHVMPSDRFLMTCNPSSKKSTETESYQNSSTFWEIQFQGLFLTQQLP